MKPIKIKENVYWVGGIDWNLRNFHGYLTQKGSTYNAYLIIDEKITLIDTVKHYLYEEMIARISEIVDPSKIDYIISNHVEMDHSGALPKLIEIAKNAVIITSPKGEPGLRAHYKQNWPFKVIANEDILNIGKRNLHFALTPMVHWPDNMVVHCPEDKILFSNDAFGQHLATSERFDDEYPLTIIFEEAKKYYANIVLPYGVQVKRALSAVSQLEIEIIAPSHGIIWRKNVPLIVKEYEKWAANETTNKALVIYDSMWGSTQKIAQALQSAFDNKGYHTHMLNLQYNHISDIMTEVLTAKYVCIGSPTLNNNMLPTVSAFLTYFKGLAPKKRIGLAFGSYGWGGQSIEHIHTTLKECGLELLDPVRIQYIPDNDQLTAITRQVENSIE